MFEFGIHSLCVHPEEQTELSVFPFQRFPIMFTRAGTERVGRHEEVAPMGLVSPAAETRKPGLCLQTQSARGRNILFYIRKPQTSLETELKGLLSRHFCKIQSKSYMTAEAIIKIL